MYSLQSAGSTSMGADAQRSAFLASHLQWRARPNTARGTHAHGENVLLVLPWLYYNVHDDSIAVWVA